MVSLVLISISNIPVLTVIFLLIKSCGTPIIYYIGIEENRALTREFVKSQIKYFVPKSKSPPIVASQAVSSSNRQIWKNQSHRENDLDSNLHKFYCTKPIFLILLSVIVIQDPKNSKQRENQLRRGLLSGKKLLILKYIRNWQMSFIIQFLFLFFFTRSLLITYWKVVN